VKVDDRFAFAFDSVSKLSAIRQNGCSAGHRTHLHGSLLPEREVDPVAFFLGSEELAVPKNGKFGFNHFRRNVED